MCTFQPHKVAQEQCILKVPPVFIYTDGTAGTYMSEGIIYMCTTESIIDITTLLGMSSLLLPWKPNVSGSLICTDA